VGITLSELELLQRQFETRGIRAVKPLRGRTAHSALVNRGIEKTPGVCGGAARVSGTRIPVWQLVAAREMGASEAQLLLDYPSLRAQDLVNAWAFATSHQAEVEAEIRENEVV
jgi:uncharacterized protein (DUF433 family)